MKKTRTNTLNKRGAESEERGRKGERSKKKESKGGREPGQGSLGSVRQSFSRAKSNHTVKHNMLFSVLPRGTFGSLI